MTDGNLFGESTGRQDNRNGMMIECGVDHESRGKSGEIWMPSVKNKASRYALIAGGLVVIIAVVGIALAFEKSGNSNERKFVAPSDPAWHYTNGTWTPAEEPDWGEVMKGKQLGVRASIETDSAYAILKQRGNGGEITVFVDGKPEVTAVLPQDGAVHEIPIFQDSKGWRKIEAAFSGTGGEIGGLFVSQKSKVRKPEDGRKKLVVIGHSYAAGCCINDRGLKSFAPLLGDMLNVESINVGIGRTDINVGGKYSGLGRVESDVIAFKPDYVLSVYGFNAIREIAAGRTTHEQYEADYTKFIRTITESLPQTRVFASSIISIGGYSDEMLTPYNQDIQKACSSVANCTFIDLSGKWNADNYDLYVSSDGIHPSEEGHRFLAEVYAEAISKY